MRFLAVLVCLTAAPLFAGEDAVLASGSRIRVDRHEIEGEKARLFIGAGAIEMNAALIRQFEHVDDLAPAAASHETAQPIESQTPVSTPTVSELADAAADKYGLDRRLVHSVIAAESGFQSNAISPKGAIGPMQLMPSTAQELGADPRDPAQNVDAGTRYLRDLLVKYDGRLWHALAAYNAGPGAVDKYNGVPPYRETYDYIRRIDRKLKQAPRASTD
jgi:soluble lytic murein transglycosylase-like protein